MSATLKALYEKKGKAWKRATEINELAIKEGRAFNTEEQAEYDKLNREMTEATEAITRTKALATVGENRGDEGAEGGEGGEGGEHRGGTPGREDRGGKPGKRQKRNLPAVKEEVREEAFAGWCRAQRGLPLKRSQRRACQEIGLSPNNRHLDVRLCDTRTYRQAQDNCRSGHPQNLLRSLSATNLATGGALVPSSFVNALEINMLAFGGMMQEAEVIRTATGGEMRWPTADDASNEGSQIGENTAVGDDTDPAFAQQVWRDYKFKSGVITAAYELLEDASFDLASQLGAMIGERIGRIVNRRATTGNGAGTMEGITVGAAVGKTAAATTSFTPNEIINLIHSIDPAYRIGAKFMMHDSIVMLLRLFKETGTDQYLWQPGLKDGVPDKLFGYPVAINQHMDSAPVASAKTMIFGQLTKYKIRQVGGLRFYRLLERYRDNDQDGFLAFTRVDGRLLRASATNTAVKSLTQAAA